MLIKQFFYFFFFLGEMYDAPLAITFHMEYHSQEKIAVDQAAKK